MEIYPQAAFRDALRGVRARLMRSKHGLPLRPADGGTSIVQPKAPPLRSLPRDPQSLARSDRLEPLVDGVQAISSATIRV